MKIIANISRILVGIVFIFSSFVKGIDPLGTAYKMEDYFLAWGWEWALPFALFLSISMCTLEFILGVACLLNLRLKYMAWPLGFLMLYFTVLTFVDAVHPRVPDCGCFGDAIKLTNWETFYKNIVLIVLVGIIFLYRKKFVNKWPQITQTALLAVFIVLFSGFSIYNYRHLPMIDFRGWENGTDLNPAFQVQDTTYSIYKNQVTGEIREYLTKDIPWQDSLWKSQWIYLDRREVKGKSEINRQVSILDYGVGDWTESFLLNSNYQFILISWSINEASSNGFLRASELSESLILNGHSFIVVSGTGQEDVEKFKIKFNPDLEYYMADEIELKRMIRSNPGLMLLKDGIVLDKWAWRDIPDFESLKKKFPDL
jgi:hypothetical protein